MNNLGSSPEMGDNVSEMAQKLLQNRQPGVSPLQCSECDLVCPSLPVLEFHTKLHVMEKMVQRSYEYSKIYGLKKPSDDVNKQNGKQKEVLSPNSKDVNSSNAKNKSLNQQNSPKEKYDTHKDEARDIETIMESLVSQGASDENSCSNSGSSYSPEVTMRSPPKVQLKGTGIVVRRHKCDECGFRFKNTTHLKRHMRTHTGEKPYACSECDYTCARTDKLKKHMKLHTECDDSSLQKDKLNEHKEDNIVTTEDTHTERIAESDAPTTEGIEIKKIKHDQKSKEVKCPDCDYKCTLTSMLKSHMVKHSDERPFSCNECISRFKTKDHLKRHMLTHLNAKSRKSKCFPCTQCEFTCSNKKKLARHMVTHPGIKLHSCPLCDYKCNEEGNLVKHLKIHGDEKPFSCPEEGCDYKCKIKCNLKTHMLKHSGDNLHACPLCDYITNLKVNLASHMSVKHSGGYKAFSCPEEGCDYKCKLKCNLKTHMLKHSGERPHACHLCDYRSMQKGNLKIHMLKHSGEKPFICPACGNRYAVKGDLKIHMRIHTNDKKFKCQLCDYRCFTQQRLNQHILKHTGEKPHECDECGLRFTSGSNLKRHLRTHYKNMTSVTKPKFVSRKPKKGYSRAHSTMDDNAVGSQGIFASQLLNDLRHHSEDSSDSSQAHQHFHQGNTQPINNQQITGANNIHGRSSQETTHSNVSYKMYSNDTEYQAISKKYSKFVPSVKPLWNQDSSSMPTATTDGYNCQLLSDLYTRKVTTHAGENLAHITQNYSHNPLVPYPRPMFVNSSEITHLNSKIPSTIPAPPNMTEMLQHANDMYNNIQ